MGIGLDPVVLEELIVDGNTVRNPGNAQQRSCNMYPKVLGYVMPCFPQKYSLLKKLVAEP